MLFFSSLFVVVFFLIIIIIQIIEPMSKEVTDTLETSQKTTIWVSRHMFKKQQI